LPEIVDSLAVVHEERIRYSVKLYTVKPRSV